MKKDYLYIPFIITGVAIGYFVAFVGGLKGWNLFWEMWFGGLLGLMIGTAFLEKQYGILAGAAIGLIISSSLDILAGSPITIRDKLGDMFFGSFIGWYFPIYLRQMLIGGIIGGILGFGWGMIHSHRVGNMGFLPGEGAMLLAILWFILGMGAVKFYMMAFGYRFLRSSNQED